MILLYLYGNSNFNEFNPGIGDENYLQRIKPLLSIVANSIDHWIFHFRHIITSLSSGNI
ncbi:hypothetical protein GXM_10264 [Nostoc sphaeroides CCNUC1]|uniref:Uncharacterized protein n=1 Tax=Nostoc sphaeroides CCNUC1 TaxID=2653204 RepID=A0A5P8WKA9_9NOSO|nr:hypothetical protein GXM_10264 [Nostoc sphaeroides CCNUC1]